MNLTPKQENIVSARLLKHATESKDPLRLYTFQVVSQHTRHLERRGGVKEVAESRGKKKPAETSVFSDEDFEKMNKEWLKLY